MGTVKICIGLICLAFIGRDWGFNSGIVGYGTEAEKVVTGRSAPHNDAARIIEIARKEIGVRESNCQNCGITVARYLAYVGFKTPQPWCAAMISYIFKEAGYAQPRTAWSPSLFPTSRIVKEPKPGIVYGIYFANLGRIGHCGLTESVRNSWLTGIEGNTNVSGSREGDGVYRRVRHKRTIYRYADWIK